MDAMNLDPKVGTGNDVNAQEGQKEDAGGVEMKGAAAPYCILDEDCEVCGRSPRSSIRTVMVADKQTVQIGLPGHARAFNHETRTYTRILHPI